MLQRRPTPSAYRADGASGTVTVMMYERCCVPDAAV